MQQLAAPPSRNGDASKLLDDIRGFAGVVRRGWRLVVIGVAVGLVVAIIALARAKVTYRSSARLLVIQQAGRPLQAAGNIDPFQKSEGQYDSLATHLMIIRSPVIVERAIAASGQGHLSIHDVIGGLSVKQPDDMARIIEVTYKAGSRDEAARVMDGVILSYNGFLRDNFQKNTNEVISLILKARDELNTELRSLEQQYLEFRQKNPAYSADDKGRSFIVRRLDQWDQAMNQVLARSLQLKTQLDLGRKLSGEGLDQDTITNALNQLGGLGGNAPMAPLMVTAQATGGTTIERVKDELADLEAQRASAEHILSHLRRELAQSSSSRTVSDRELARAFYAEADVAGMLGQRREAEARLQTVQRLSRSHGDPSYVAAKRRLDEVDGEIQRLWEIRKPIIVERLTRDPNSEIAAAIRKAEADLITLRAKEAALGERLRQVVADYIRRLHQEHEQLARLRGADDPQVRQVERQITLVEKGNDQAPDRRPGPGRSDVLLDSIARSLESIEAMRNDLQKKFDEDLSASKVAEINQLGEANLRSNLDRQRTLFNSVVDQLKQAQLVSDFGSVSAQTINPTEVAAERPNSSFILALALFGGFGFGALAALAADVLDARIRSVAEMRAQFDLPVIGLIPQLSEEQVGTTGSVGLLSYETPRSALAESYKSTRTNLEFLRRSRRAQVLLVSSPQPGDGKSTTASNLGITLAHAGRRVLLIDGDLRKPSMHAIYGVSRAPGLAEALESDWPIAHLAQPTQIENLRLLTTGADASNPAELLASPRLGEILEELRREYDIVIIDSSPLLAVTDPSIVASVADGVLLVVRVGETRRHDAERTMELLDTMDIPVLGLVINGISREYGGHGYGYGAYGYGQGAPHATAEPQSPGAAEPVDRRVVTSLGNHERNGAGNGPLGRANPS